MQRITIISSIIAAVCVFQTVEAGVFDKLPLGKQILNPLGNLGNGQIMKSNPMEICMKAYNDGWNSVDQMKTAFGSCFSDKTNLETNTNIQHLSDAVNKLQASMSEAYEEAMKCDGNMMTKIPCLIKVHQEKAPGLTPLLKDAMSAASDVMQMTRENMSECYQMAIESSQDIINKHVAEGEECINSVKNLWPF